jgi:hypothetical protein
MAQQAGKFTSCLHHVGEGPWSQYCRYYLREDFDAAGLHFTKTEFLRTLNNLFEWPSNQSRADLSLKEKVALRICDANGNNCH